MPILIKEELRPEVLYRLINATSTQNIILIYNLKYD
jgi:hypothetical protein